MPRKVTPRTQTEKKTPSKRTSRKSGAAIAAASELEIERIRARAYEIYQAGRNPSDPVADWFQAERELRAEMP